MVTINSRGLCKQDIIYASKGDIVYSNKTQTKQYLGKLSNIKQQSLVHLIKSCGKHDNINEK